MKVASAANMATIARLENRLRLSSFADQVSLREIRGAAEGENEHKDNDRCREEYSKHCC